jgi:IS30 family transposase
LDAKPSPKLDNPALTQEIMRLFKQDLSPDQIAGRFKVRYPDRKGQRASPSTIYRHVYQETTKTPLIRVHFSQKQAKPRRLKGVQYRRSRIPDHVSIDERPNIVEEQSRVGDWDGDTVECAGKNACLATFVDRKTKLLLANIMPDKTAAALNRSAVRAFKPISDQMRNALTLDNGKEFAAHKSLSHAPRIDIYFARPYHSWEQGLNEHANGMLRQYCLKKCRLTDLCKNSLPKSLPKSTIGLTRC